VRAFLKHRELQDSEQTGASGSWHEQHLVFPNTMGGLMDYANFVPRYFKPLLR
jgi:hypothetical protein